VTETAAHKRCEVCDARGCIESRCPVHGCCGETNALIVVNDLAVCVLGGCAEIAAEPSVAELAASLAGARPCR
jgi:hypothetical protein